MTNNAYCGEQGTLLGATWQAVWVGSLGENGHVYMYDQVPSRSTSNCHIIVNLLHPNTK